ncbi:diaminopimelate epimerase [Helicobacter cinaedi]|uniref:diaminopimelate epimerase n=1 Tax=Helicobacter cinaedi TaxID=213 RepID=UPI000CF05DF7|nr:diaminopimelate epimerase [Helicobacter cinaedi]
MRFVKYSSSGNDFLICQSFERDNGGRSSLAKRVCERHNGIGADGMVVLLLGQDSKDSKKYAYEWEFYNADGSKAKMCGNASRSIGHYAFVEGIAPRKHSFLSQAGIIGITIDESDTSLVQSDLGAYKLVEEHIVESNPYGVKAWALLDSGVPHLVGFVNDKKMLTYSKDELLRALREKYNANVNLAYIDESSDRSRILYMTYERGVEDITQACGTGAAAVFAMALRLGLCGKKALLIPPSNEILELQMTENQHILFKGKVQRIAICEWLNFI